MKHKVLGVHTSPELFERFKESNINTKTLFIDTMQFGLYFFAENNFTKTIDDILFTYKTQLKNYGTQYAYNRPYYYQYIVELDTDGKKFSNVDLTVNLEEFTELISDITQDIKSIRKFYSSLTNDRQIVQAMYQCYVKIYGIDKAKQLLVDRLKLFGYIGYYYYGPVLVLFDESKIKILNIKEIKLN